jgi:seryl-tRNA synthetase
LARACTRESEKSGVSGEGRKSPGPAVQCRDPNIDQVASALQARGYALDVEAYKSLEERRKDLQQQLQDLQNRRNQSAKSIGQAKAQGEDIQPLLDQVGALGQELAAVESAFREVRDRQRDWHLDMPNLAADDVPVGEDESANREIRRWGDIPEFDFDPRDHVELGQRNGLLDAEAAAKLSGARFTVLRGGLSRLHRALAQFMLDVQTTEHGYTEVYLPYLVNAETMQGTGQLPKFGEDAFATTDEPPRYLVPTAEVPMTNLAAGMIYAAGDLPLRMTSQTPCFRREAGSHGKDTRGMMAMPKPSCKNSICLTARLFYPRVIWASPHARRTISRSGCRGRAPFGKFPRAATAATSRHGACRRAGAIPTPASPNWCIRSTVRAWRSAGR